ncbi:MAG TPA: hypothetical protein PKM43_21305 [Verrucomicrobiota bacterium]|nr:hypothetical protein [Verrucomicrobiota bacterium]
MNCNALLEEARAIVTQVEGWPLDAPFLGEMLTQIVHACEGVESRRAREVVERARAVAQALGVRDDGH